MHEWFLVLVTVLDDRSDQADVVGHSSYREARAAFDAVSAGSVVDLLLLDFAGRVVDSHGNSLGASDVPARVGRYREDRHTSLWVPLPMEVGHGQ